MENEEEGKNIKISAEGLESGPKNFDTEPYLLRLYVSGSTPQSLRAIKNLQTICEEKLHGQYNLEVINLYEHPELAKTEQIIAVPTLVKKLPLPIRHIIGDLSDFEKVLIGIGVK